LELESQLAPTADTFEVEVLIGDNVTTDKNSEILDPHIKRNCPWAVFRHPDNLGPDANILSLLERSQGKYRLFIGDDDLPCPGVISQILELLDQSNPSLVYLPSESSPDISAINQDPIDLLTSQQMCFLTRSFSRSQQSELLNGVRAASAI